MLVIETLDYTIVDDLTAALAEFEAVTVALEAAADQRGTDET